MGREKEKEREKRKKNSRSKKRTGAIKWKRNTIHFTSNNWKAKSVSFSPFQVNHCAPSLSVCQTVSAWCLKDHFDSASCVIFCLSFFLSLSSSASYHFCVFVTRIKHLLLLMNFTDIVVFITFPKNNSLFFHFVGCISFSSCFASPNLLEILLNLCDTIIMWKETKRNGKLCILKNAWDFTPSSALKEIKRIYYSPV